MTLEDIYRLLRAGHVQAQGVVDTITQPLLVLDANLCVVTANPAFLHAFHVERDETIGEPLVNLGSGQWNFPGLLDLLHEVIPRSAAVIGYEVTHDFPGVGRRTMLVTARRLSHPDNNSLYMLVVFDDVTDTRQHAATQDLIVAEIEHRLRNFLALVSALAKQIPAEGDGASAYRDAFLARLEVLTHAELGLFSQSGNDLGFVIGSVLAPYGGKVVVDRGPVVKLRRQQVRPLSMILHEMATNAQKYGALSAEDGRVELNWETDGNTPGQLIITWRETGGPAAPENRREGFGSRLIRSLVEMELNGSIDARFAAEGLTARIAIPMGEGQTP